MRTILFQLPEASCSDFVANKLTNKGVSGYINRIIPRDFSMFKQNLILYYLTIFIFTYLFSLFIFALIIIKRRMSVQPKEWSINSIQDFKKFLEYIENNNYIIVNPQGKEWSLKNIPDQKWCLESPQGQSITFKIFEDQIIFDNSLEGIARIFRMNNQNNVEEEEVFQELVNIIMEGILNIKKHQENLSQEK